MWRVIAIAGLAACATVHQDDHTGGDGSWRTAQNVIVAGNRGLATAGPRARTFSARVAWNPARGHLTLAGDTADSWEWFGDHWEPLDTLTQPVFPMDAQIASTHAGIVMFGGLPLNAPSSDTWELRFEATGTPVDEVCHAADIDGDHRTGCPMPDGTGEPDCWFACGAKCSPHDQTCS